MERLCPRGDDVFGGCRRARAAVQYQVLGKRAVAHCAKRDLCSSVLDPLIFVNQLCYSGCVRRARDCRRHALGGFRSSTLVLVLMTLGPVCVFLL